MKTLSFDEMKRVSGAGHFGDVRDANMGKSNKNTGSNNKGNTFWVWGRVWLVVRLQEAVFLTEMEMAVVAVNPPEVIVVQEWAAPVNNRS